MRRYKLLAGVISLMFLLIPLSIPSVTAGENEVTVILVSNNEADSALAHYIANFTGDVIVQTPWGVYDPNVTAEVMEYAPDSVIIIGGPDAVSGQYETDLKSLGIPVERWGGANRYDTNLIVLKNARLQLNLSVEGNAVVVPGNDSVAIQKALKLSVGEKGLLLFVNASTNLSVLRELFGIPTFKTTLIATQVTRSIIVKISSEIPGEKAIIANISPEEAKKAITDAEVSLKTAENMTTTIGFKDNTTGNEYGLMVRFMKIAKESLLKAQEAYKKGEYTEAYELALISKGQSEVVIKSASAGFVEKLKLDPEFRYSLALFRYQAQERILARAGINTTQLHKLILQLKDAISKGEYDILPSLMAQIQNELRRLFMEGKPFLREKIYFPLEHGGGLGEP